MSEEIIRCSWCGDDPIYMDYHDNEWGKPIYDSQKLFELLCLEGAQAGLSWITILKKRENYREVFKGFDVETVANFSEAKIRNILTNPKIVRNKLKINSVVTNARAYLEFQKEGRDFGEWLWGFVEGKPIINSPKSHQDIPPQTELSKKISKELKSLGFKFVGPTIVYAFMQSAGLVNDHIETCSFRF